MTDPMSLTHAVVYVVLGFAVGAFGTLIGVGGGWLLAPILVFLHPYEPAISLTAISLAVVCVNAASGSFAYARMGRVDFRAALAFSAAGLPGSRGSLTGASSIRCSEACWCSARSPCS